MSLDAAAHTPESPAAAGDEQIYTPAPGEKQFSARAIVAGCLLGGLVACMNIYFGLRTGWTEGGSLIAAILAFGFFAVAGGSRLSVLETNIAQTTGSAAGTKSSAQSEKYGFPVATGLLAGEGLMGVVTALLTLAGLNPKSSADPPTTADDPARHRRWRSAPLLTYRHVRSGAVLAPPRWPRPDGKSVGTLGRACRPLLRQLWFSG